MGLCVALDRYRPAEDLEQIHALEDSRALIAPVLTDWARLRVRASRSAFAAALGFDASDPAFPKDCRALIAIMREGADELRRCFALVQAEHTEAMRDLQRSLEAPAPGLLALEQLLGKEWTPWDGRIVGAETAVPIEVFDPIIAEAADLQGKVYTASGR